jgi:hypothetical protein
VIVGPRCKLSIFSAAVLWRSKRGTAPSETGF